MRKIFLSIVFLLCITNLQAAIQLSDSANVSLLTCEPSQDAVYTYFGHTSIRIQDKANDIDWIFNYGVFSFDQPYFIPKFIKGETDYELGISYTDTFLNNYKQRGSTVYEQTLNLTPQEKQKLWDSLMHNYEPQNRTYRYNFVFDNCATRPCVMLALCCNGELIYGGFLKKTTYRKLVEEYVGKDSWLKFGIDLVFGTDADQVIGLNHEDLFLPTHVMQKIKQAVIVNDEEIRPILLSEQTYNANKKEKKIIPNFLKQATVCSFILIISLLIFILEKSRKRYAFWFDSIIFSCVGIAGIVISYLMFFSNHPLVASNWNLLWANPLNLIFGISLFKKATRKYLVYYQYINCLFFIISLLLYVIKIQILNIAFMPLITLLLIRAILYISNQKKSISV